MPVNTAMVMSAPRQSTAMSVFTDTTTRRDVIDAAYREKYGEASSYVNTMVRDDVASTTLRLSPK